MDNAGLLLRTHGGAVKIKETAFEQIQTIKEKERIAQKRAIARRAYEEIKDKETIILDAGSTNHELAKLIKKGERSDLVIITNAFNIANELMHCEKVECIFAGGLIRPQILSCVGLFTEDLFQNVSVDRAFIGTNNISVEHALTTPNMQECRVKQSMLMAARKKYVLADSSKFRTNSLYCVCKFKDLNLIITDDELDESYIAKINGKGGRIETVNMRNQQTIKM